MRGGRVVLLHKIGYVLEVAAFCSLILSKVWRVAEHSGFVVTVMLMVGSMYCLARAELPK
jgi:acetolactate synthase regulatory subunit